MKSNIFLYNEVTYFLSKLIPNKSLRRRTKGSIRWHIEHPKIALYLKTHYINPLLQGKLKSWDFAPKHQAQNLEGKKIIWILWFQGEQNAPHLVKTCIDSVRKYMSDEYSIIVLDSSNLSQYLYFPLFVSEKIELFGKAFFSDLVRVALLCTYGGIWLDATILLTDKIPARFCEKDFFAMQRSLVPPVDSRRWVEFDYRYFVWERDFCVRMLSSFLVAKPKHKIMNALSAMLMAFWEKENHLEFYFTLQVLFDLLMREPSFEVLNCEITNDTDIHLLKLHAKEPFNENLWKEICQITTMHKLNFKDTQNMEKKGIYQGSMIQGALDSQSKQG